MKKKLKIKFLSAIIIGIILLPTCIFSHNPNCSCSREFLSKHLSSRSIYNDRKGEKH